ncbi:hypothetical protein ROE7235_01235 [Roseibaca ekhonensis]|uniref:CHAD domain-containing protein n=1 Tax=Roseinatronobacter ekhonensis TaxID=254356 RepID=A0A3B0MPD6_9RHOB|nr:CHAD domain-containing protein [Roseibaca ekhonensis]SUZ31489.1 hypothetical protein ROE7235_01235 [Roseibaca ekhonensis]
MKLSYPPERPKLQPALRQTLVARANMACDAVAAHGSGASVFELRKRAKEIRGLLRLLRGGWEGARDWNARIRDAAAKLAPARDAEVMFATFDSLTAKRRAPAEFDSLRDMLLDEIDICDAALQEDALEQFAATMNAFATDAKALHVPDKTAPVVWHNLGRTWAKGQLAHAQAAQAGQDATAFHDWRKRLKQHWYQARFFKPIDRAGLGEHIAQVDALGKTLGAHNDLDVLHMFLRATCPADPALGRLEPDLLAARAKLATQTLSMGRRLYAAPDPAQDWPARWQTWRNG